MSVASVGSRIFTASLLRASRIDGQLERAGSRVRFTVSCSCDPLTKGGSEVDVLRLGQSSQGVRAAIYLGGQVGIEVDENDALTAKGAQTPARPAKPFSAQQNTQSPKHIEHRVKLGSEVHRSGRVFKVRDIPSRYPIGIRNGTNIAQEGNRRPMPRERPTRTRADGQRVPAVEEHLAGLEAQLGELKSQVHQAQQLAGLGTAAATIAHEMNNLLTPILAYSQAALSAGDTALQEKALKVTVKNVRMLVAMSERVLEISAARSSSPELVSVREVTEDALASLCRDLSKDGIVTKLDIDESLQVWSDPLHLQQVLFNLFLNAREAMVSSRSGRLTVSAASRDDKVVIEVRDTGVGIEPELLGFIFDPLTTSKPAQRNGRHRCGGLGLSLCRDLIEENGGSIRVSSEPGAGTTFTIALPARSAGE